MALVTVTPAPGMAVRHESGKPFNPATDNPVEQSVWWLRRERDGDVVLTPAAAEVVDAKSKPAR